MKVYELIKTRAVYGNYSCNLRMLKWLSFPFIECVNGVSSEQLYQALTSSSLILQI